MGKILMVVLILGFIYLFIVPSFRKSTKKDSKDDKKEIQNFVECDKCSTYIEINEAIMSGGKYICKECIRK
ncbi:MAG: hypothetical protein GX282_00975 [Campylobacteraceae bacterium]|nr:hypothetical protein [Campylobacteraceae bacterium]